MNTKNAVVGAIVVALILAGSLITYSLTRSEPEISQPTPSSEPSTTNSTQTTTQPEPSSNLTQAELITHNSAQDCWLLIDGTVYNVTTYINQHPGGAERIIPNCGTDATAAFESQGNPSGGDSHSSFARNTLSEFALGPITD